MERPQSGSICAAANHHNHRRFPAAIGAPVQATEFRKNLIVGQRQEIGGSRHLVTHPLISAENEELLRLQLEDSRRNPYEIVFPQHVRQKLIQQKRMRLRIQSEAWRPSRYDLSNPDSRLLGVTIGKLEFMKEGETGETGDLSKRAHSSLRKTSFLVPAQANP